MKKTVLVCLASLFAVSAFGAGQFRDTEVGPVMAIDRAFIVDLAECEKTYRANGGILGSCEVKVRDAVMGEDFKGGSDITASLDEGDGRTLKVNVKASATGYTLSVNRLGGSSTGTLRFTYVKNFLREALDRIPAQQVVAVIHTARR